MLPRVAMPLADTFETHDALQAQSGSRSGDAPQMQRFNPATAPKLSFTKIHSVILNGKRLAPTDTYWNNLLRAVLNEAKESLSTEEVMELLICNAVIGKKEKGGYNFLPNVGISIQAADANKAWMATYLVAQVIKSVVEVEFSWQHNSKAAMPGQSGKFILDWNDQQ